MGGEVGEVEAPEEAVDVFLGVPVFITLTGITEVTVVAEFLKVFILDVEESHYGFVVINLFPGFLCYMVRLLFYDLKNSIENIPVCTFIRIRFHVYSGKEIYFNLNFRQR